MTQPVEISRDGAVLVLRLRRPDKKNAITAAMYAAMADALAGLERDDTLRAALITGSDGLFTAGNDLTDFLQNPPAGEDSPVFRFIAALPRADKPLVAAVDGPAVGVGTTMLLHCDLVYVTARARLQVPFVNLGLLPEAGSTYLLPRLIGHARAAELVMLGEPIDGEAAVRLGIASRVVAPDELEATALAAARALADKPPAAMRITKQLLKSDRPAVEAAMRREGEEFIRRLRSAEAREAFAAFLEKRKPDFSSIRE